MVLHKKENHLRNHSVHNTPRISGSSPSWCKRIKLVKEDDTWTCWSGLWIKVDFIKICSL